MSISRRQFLHSVGTSAVALGVERSNASARSKLTSVLEVAPLEPPFRLPVRWHQQTVKRLQNKLGEKGLDGIILKDRWNIIYVSGLFHSTTERPFWLFVPAKGDPAFFHPGLDRDLVDTWWIKDRAWYFDFPHAGEFNQIVWTAGKRVELEQWMLKELGKRGFGKAKLGIEQEVGPKAMAKLKEALPEATFEEAGDILMNMRQVKTPEEIDLTQKAIDLHDRMLEFARAYILMHGTDVTDFDIRHATQAWATEQLMKVMKLDGRPHNGVGIRLEFGCRAGVATAYPHPNQFFYKRLEKGDAIQIASVIQIGGYGGEGYRALQTYPMNDPQKKMWEVHTEMTLLQAELCKAGTRCQEVAEKVLALAKKAGLEKYVYHRPAHGQGMEGHQAPYLALGDETVLEEGMMFSNEPGLYNPEGGYGYNHSNCVLVGKERGIVMNKTPLTKQWCWLEI
jgi:Xaa-Pro aminopeptidase